MEGLRFQFETSTEWESTGFLGIKYPSPTVNDFAIINYGDFGIDASVGVDLTLELKKGQKVPKTEEWYKEEDYYYDRDLRKCLGISNIMGRLPKYVEKGEQATIAGVLCDYYVSDEDGYKDEYWVACDTGFIMKYQYTMAEYGYSSVTEVTPSRHSPLRSII